MLMLKLMLLFYRKGVNLRRKIDVVRIVSLGIFAPYRVIHTFPPSIKKNRIYNLFPFVILINSQIKSGFWQSGRNRISR